MGIMNSCKTKEFKSNKEVKSNNINYILENGNKIDNSIEIADATNTYFCDIGKNLSEKIKSNKETVKLPKHVSKRGSQSRRILRLWQRSSNSSRHQI